MPEMTDTQLTRDIARSHGLTPEEYEHIKKILGRDPTVPEIGMFGVMWSEHCSYKCSRPVLKLLPREGAKVLVKAGEENAGVIDIGDGLAIAFKIESHNHPSAVEPFQGAATGVGGILRDIFTMGARPVLLMNSLRFGNLESPVARRLLRGVVAGIAHYGNCIGVPTVGGEVYFDESYEGNPLVNAMCLGILRSKELVKGIAKGTGNPVFYVGSATGRDGLGGASFASREITEASNQDRPSVQVGDPFLEKLLLEACLEMIPTGAMVGLQDMGAAGFTCSTCETAARGLAGMTVDVARVPRRETGMTPYEVLLSESQERMLLIAEKGKEDVIEKVFSKWDLHAEKVGEVTEGNLLKVYDGEKLVAEIPAKALADESPVYVCAEKEPAYLKEVQSFDPLSLPEPKDCGEVLKRLLDHPSIASKEWVYRQYDHMVRTDTVFLPGHDAALIRIKGSKKGVAVSTDCNSVYCYLDPYEGGKIAVAEAARNVVATGGVPVGLTNCLNFGNPMDPEIFWQFRRCVEGMRDACLAMNVPVTGGNVSFYNESPQGAIYPTPTIGMVGVLDDVDLRVPSFFQKEGDVIFLVGETGNDLGGTHYLAVCHGVKKGIPPRLDLEKEKKLYDLILKAGRDRLLVSCHDLSEGGLAVALAECGFSREKLLAAHCPELEKVKPDAVRTDAFLFGETQTRMVVTVEKESAEAFRKLAGENGVPCAEIGAVGAGKLKLGKWIEASMKELHAEWREALPKRVGVI